MITIVLAGRNDDYGKGFCSRLFRATEHNVALLSAAGIRFEYILAEWNPLPDDPPLSVEFVRRIPHARAVIIPPRIHEIYSLNPGMPFHEMAAKNAALRRARGAHVVVVNADILLTEEVVDKIAEGDFRADTLYRAHRIDVEPTLSWAEMKNPENQITSGEGILAPCYYLGAGGDFCLADRRLWWFLRGFNERIRFSTRAKDWQFFLSAAAQQVEIACLGNVYHLDHEEGFRNTPPKERDSAGAHFGGCWDIEFGLPVTNPHDWGFGRVSESAFSGERRIRVLDAEDFFMEAGQDRIDRMMSRWLTFPAGGSDGISAILFHAILAAHRQNARLICRFRDERSLATLSGFTAAASGFGIPIHCNWRWPEFPGFTTRPFPPEPGTLADGDWVVTCNESVIRIIEQTSGGSIDVFPTVLPIRDPEYNPVMIRRLLRACLQLQKIRARRIALYGAGSHTESLLRWGFPDSIEIAAIVTSGNVSGNLFGLPVISSNLIETLNIDAVLLSSCSFEPEMAEQAGKSGVERVIKLYGDWPRNLWTARGTVSPASGLREHTHEFLEPSSVVAQEPNAQGLKGQRGF